MPQAARVRGRATRAFVTDRHTHSDESDIKLCREALQRYDQMIARLGG